MTALQAGNAAASPAQRSVPAAPNPQIAIGLGEGRVTSDVTEELICYGLGSCVGLCVYDPVVHLAGMAHMVLPDSAQAPKTRGGPKFVDVAVPTLLDRMMELGASRGRMRITLVGGAHILRGAGFADTPPIGERNVEAAIAALTSRGLRAQSMEIGGSRGRTVVLSARTGELSVTTAGVGT